MEAKYSAATASREAHHATVSEVRGESAEETAEQVVWQLAMGRVWSGRVAGGVGARGAGVSEGDAAPGGGGGCSGRARRSRDRARRSGPRGGRRRADDLCRTRGAVLSITPHSRSGPSRPASTTAAWLLAEGAGYLYAVENKGHTDWRTGPNRWVIPEGPTGSTITAAPAALTTHQARAHERRIRAQSLAPWQAGLGRRGIA